MDVSWTTYIGVYSFTLHYFAMPYVFLMYNQSVPYIGVEASLFSMTHFLICSTHGY